MISAATLEFMGYLSHESRLCRALLEDHVDAETGEVFPHLWMARVTDAFCAGRFNQTEQDALLHEAEKHLKPEDDSLSNLIAVSFVENLPPPLQQGYKLIAGYPALLRQYAIVFGTP